MLTSSFLVHRSHVTVHPAMSTRQEMSKKCSTPSRLISLHAPSLALLANASGPSSKLCLFLLVLNHTVDDELEDGYPFVTDVVGCIRTSRREVAF